MAQKDFISRYNQFSGYFWLLIAGLSFIVITFKIITEGPETWLAYYVVPVIGIGQDQVFGTFCRGVGLKADALHNCDVVLASKANQQAQEKKAAAMKPAKH